MKKNTPMVLLILDGWGYSPDDKYNAINAADTPYWDKCLKEYPNILLNASGENVGLPQAQMGNSEVGHMHIGAGRIILQDFTRINASIYSGEFNNNVVLNDTLNFLNKNKVGEHSATLHLMGLISDGGVHSHEKHLFALIDYFTHYAPTQKISLHLFLDGRDTPPQSAIQYIQNLLKHIDCNQNIIISTISGRFYAMDRDKRFERLESLYKQIVLGDSQYIFLNAIDCINYFYKKNIFDEFIPPSKIENGIFVKPGDAIICFNFRADRMRQLSEAFIYEDYNNFNRGNKIQNVKFATMTQYSKSLATDIIFPRVSINNSLGEILSKHKYSQLRIAETEKYPHVTYFFNGGNENVFPKEDRILIPSPKVRTYDEKPQMSIFEITEQILEKIQENTFDVYICNFANADMVGHTGNFNATKIAIECIDKCIEKIAKAILKKQGCMLITADHGNAEQMYDTITHQTHTAHTTSKVPLLFIGNGYKFIYDCGELIDIAPSILNLLQLPIPKEMSGKNLMAEI